MAYAKKNRDKKCGRQIMANNGIKSDGEKPPRLMPSVLQNVHETPIKQILKKLKVLNFHIERRRL